MRAILAVVCAFLLTACVGNPPRPVDIVRHDLGDPHDPAGRWPATGIAISRVDVRAAAWLDSSAQWYRLSYADPLTRHSYAENRWIAPPGELLERWLQRHILSGQNDDVKPGCRLIVWLDELDQRFAAPRSSQVVLEARASLQTLRGDAVLAQQAFHIVKTAGSPDARGGVQATRDAADALAQELARWLGELASKRPPAVTICMEKK